MRNSQIKNHFFALIILTAFSCQKDALIDVEVTSTNPTITNTPIEAEAVLFSIEDGEITVNELPPADQEFIALPEKIEELEQRVTLFQGVPHRIKNAEELCEENTMIAYEAALAEANARCEPVFAEVACELEGAIVLALLHVFPSVDCMTPPEGDPSK